MVTLSATPFNSADEDRANNIHQLLDDNNPQPSDIKEWLEMLFQM